MPLLLFYFLFISVSLLGQMPSSNYPDNRCLTRGKKIHNFQNHPELIKKNKLIQETITQSVENHSSRQTSQTIITIPVVVHIIYRTSLQNISTGQVLSQIQVLNEDYRKTNTNFNTAVPTIFHNVAADVELNFCLAKVDPLGNSTTGITRTTTSIPQIGSIQNNTIYHTANGGKDAWDETRYLNIWVCEIDNNGGLLGYATAPGTAPLGEDGVVIDYKYFGTIGTVTAPLNKGRTTTHEIGHYFGLEHIWGDGPCGTDDGIADTPEQTSHYLGCPTHPQTSCNSSDMFMNYMDYVDDACMGMFTNGQKTRMRTIINGPRVGLKNNNTACGLTSTINPKTDLLVSIYPNPSKNNTIRIEINKSEDVNLRIIDTMGKIHLKKTINQSAIINLSTLSPGIYLVEAMRKKERVITKVILN